MKSLHIKWFFLGVTLLMFSGCVSQRMEVLMVQPAEVEGIKNGSKIAISDLSGSAKSEIQQKLKNEITNKKFNGKTYLSFSGNENADLMVSGNMNVDVKESWYDRVFNVCSMYDYYRHGPVCVMYVTQRTRCDVADVVVNGNLELKSKKENKTLLSKNYNESYVADSCINRYYSVNPKNMGSASDVVSMLTQRVAEDFVSRVTPTNYSMSVPLIDDAETFLTYDQRQRMKVSLAYLKQGRVSVADDMLKQILSETKEKSAVIAYNYGVIQESYGNTKQALDLYILAEKNSKKPNNLISDAIIRVNATLHNQGIIEQDQK
jgi:tetratricopeptide (TPR) repeat protein